MKVTRHFLSEGEAGYLNNQKKIFQSPINLIIIYFGNKCSITIISFFKLRLVNDKNQAHSIFNYVN